MRFNCRPPDFWDTSKRKNRLITSSAANNTSNSSNNDRSKAKKGKHHRKWTSQSSFATGTLPSSSSSSAAVDSSSTILVTDISYLSMIIAIITWVCAVWKGSLCTALDRAARSLFSRKRHLMLSCIYVGLSQRCKYGLP